MWLRCIILNENLAGEVQVVITDEAKGNALIGEAAMNLIFNREEVTVSTLLKKLKTKTSKFIKML